MKRIAALLVLAAVVLCASAPAFAQVDVTATVGTPSASYTTLKGAFDAINAGTQGGVVTIGISGNTTETATAALNASGSGSASYSSISISPTGGAARTITGAITAPNPLIDFNGADYVTIDGLNSGGNSLTISNTTVSATSGTSTIRFQTDATNNIITRCSVLGSATMAVGTNGGNIWFGSGAIATGNDNNTVSFCDLGPAGANLPTKCVYFSGTSAALSNSGVTIDNCNIFDYFSATVSTAGIDLNTGSTDINITNNRFYQTASRTMTTTGLTHSGIRISNTSGNNYQVIGNTIGFASSTGTGTYTLVLPASSSGGFVPITLSVGTTTPTSVQGNTIAGIAVSGAASGTSSSAPFRGIYVSSGLAYIGATSGGASGTGNTIGSLGATGSITYTSSSTSTSDVEAMFNFGSSNWIVMNNSIGGITASNSSTGASSVYGIRYNTSSTAATTVQNNTVGGTVANSIQSTTTATGTIVQGILATTSSSTVTNNVVRNLTSAGGTGTGTLPAMGGLVFGSSSVNNTVSQNTIHSLSNTNATTAGHITGIMYQGSSGINLVERNLIHSLSAASASAVINGIYTNAGTTTYQNNMIRLGLDASGSRFTTGCAINGINETIAGTDNFYFNSVFIGGSGVGGTANTFAFQSAITLNTRNYIDNIFWNNRSNGSGTGKHYAIKVGGSAPNPGGLTSNYNDLLADGTGGVLGLFNLVDQPTMAAWRTATGQDGVSLSANPQFVAPNGSAATGDIHVSLVNPTPIEGAGLAVGSVLTDYDGQPRASFTPADIGADCDNFVPSDISPPVISYAALTNTCSTIARTLTATITDASGVPTAGIGLPVLYWSINAGAYTGATASWGGGSSYSFSFGAGVVPGDVVSYYIVAQDLAATPNIGSQPGGAGGFTINPPAAGTPPASPSTYTIQSTLAAGTYPIPGSYPTLTAAVAAYNTMCMGGAIVFELAAGYSSAGETFPITVNANADASAINTLTIRPAAGQTPTISGSLASGALIKLNGADYVIIDGSNSGGTDRSLTITNLATTAPCAVWMASLGIGAGATNDVVKNCNINTSAATAITAYGVSVSGATIGSIGADNDNVTVQNNAFASSNIGVYANGTATASAGGIDNLTVAGNAFTTSTTLTPVYGVEVGAAPNASVRGNTFNLITSASTQPVGISLELGVSNSSVTDNRMTAVVTTATGGYGGRGITVGTGLPSSNITIANNFVAGVNGSNYSSFGNSSSMGIAIGVLGNTSTLTTITGGVKLYHNSVNMYGSYSYASACLTAGLYVGSGASALDIRDNIIVNSMNNTNASGTLSKNYSVYSAATSAAYAPINYNDYYVSGTQGVLGYLGADQTTLSAFNTAFTGNPATPAYNVTAAFTTPTDLHIPAATTTLLESGGVGGVGVAVDIDNEARPGPPGSVNGGATAPDLGADEFDGTPVTANDMAATAFVDPTNGGTKLVGVAFSPQASFTNLGSAAQTNVTVRYRIVGPSPSPAEVYNQTAVIASIASTATTTVTFPSATLSTAGTYTIYAASELVGDQAPANDQITGTMTVRAPLSGTYLVGVSEFNRATGLDLTFERQATTVTREVLEPVERLDKSSPDADQIEWKTVTHEVEQVNWVPMSGGRAFEGSLYAEQERGERGVYATITAAVSDLNAVGVSGPVEFLLTDATYPSETFPITVNVLTNVPTATNTVTIKPNTGVTSSVSGASASATIFKVVNTNYITIDGSNSAGGTTRDLTLENTSATSPMVVWFGSSGTTPITNGTLKNCVVRNGVNTSSPVVISDGAIAGNPGYFSTMEVRNNRIEKAYIGVYATGGTTPQNGSGLTYAQNELNTSGTNAIRYVGLYMQGVSGATVTNNDIGNFEVVTAESDRGIWLATGTTNVTVNANRIHDLGYTGTSGYGAKGVVLSTGLAAANITISNNMIFNMTGDGDSYSTFGCTYSPVGIYVFGTTTPLQGGIGIYDNSVFLYGNTINYSAAAYSIGIGLDDGNSADVSGNNVVNNLGRLSFTGAGAVAIALETAASQLTGGDYNNLYSNSTGGGANLVGKIGASDYATMAAWRTASGRDANSITANPQYVANTNLHIRQDVVSPVSNAGATVGGIAADFDGDPRGATPDIGADEFTIYLLATSVVGSGSITVEPAQAAYAPGTSVTLTAIPADACQEFTGWSGSAGGNTNPLAIVMDSDKNITATFVLKTYTIAASAGTGGSITPSGDVVVDCGADQEFTITPGACYDIADVLVDNVSQGAIGSYLFEDVDQDHTIAATFVLKTYTIAASAGTGGSITPSGDVVVDCGADQEFTITPGACYDIADVLVDNVSQGAIATYTFEDVDQDHTIAASFVLKTYTIVASAGTGGSITPSGDVVVDCGADQEFTITPEACYDILDVLVDNVSQGAIATYTFEDVDQNHTIAATFVLKTYTIVASAGTGGSITPSGDVVVDCGADQEFTITADPCYDILDVVVDDVSQGAIGSYLFEDVDQSHTIAATFVLKTYTIAASAGTGGSITPSGDVVVDCGADQEFTITADPCYNILDVKVDDVSQGAIGSYLFEDVDQDHTIVASFAIKTYTLTTGVVGGGSLLIVPDQPAYDCGTSVQITANANLGWQFDHWTGNATGSDNPLTVIMDANKSITAVFIDIAGPEVFVTSPNGGEDWIVGTTHQITWTATDDSGVTGVDLAYSTDGGATYPFVIATGLANSGTYNWIIPDTPTTTAKVRVTAHDGVGNSGQDESDLVFTIEGVSPVEAVFYAAIVSEQDVVLRWVLPSYSGSLGLRIYRALSVDGPYNCITPTPLPDVAEGTYTDDTAWPGGTFWYELRVVLASGNETVPTDMHPSITVPGTLEFGIRYVSPNPTHGGASIAYSLPDGWQSARLSIYDVAGRLIRRLEPTADSRGGFATVDWDGRGDSGGRLVSGVYFVRLEVDGAVAMEKLTVLR
jgi:hypothetical protein